MTQSTELPVFTAETTEQEVLTKPALKAWAKAAAIDAKAQMNAQGIERAVLNGVIKCDDGQDRTFSELLIVPASN